MNPKKAFQVPGKPFFVDDSLLSMDLPDHRDHLSGWKRVQKRREKLEVFFLVRKE